MNKSKNILWGIAASAVVLAGLAWLSVPSEKSVLQNGTLTVSEKKFDFGETSMKNGRVSHDFKIKNEGEAPITIAKLYTSCMCTQATLKAVSGTDGPFGMPGHGIVPSINRVVGAGEEATVSVVFDPAAHGPAGVGPVDRVITIETKDGSPVNLGFRALVTP